VTRIPAVLLKQERISSNGRVLWCVLSAFADASTGTTYVSGKTVDKVLGWKGRGRRERAQRELVEAGWLQLKFRRGGRGRWARRFFVLLRPDLTTDNFHRSGQIQRHDQLPQATQRMVFGFGQSQVRSSSNTDFDCIQAIAKVT
jgi:hypothetical protein